MSVTADILATYRAPDGPVGRLIASGPREDRSLAMLMGAALLFFVARAPVLARTAALDPSVPLQAHLGISLFALLFMVPLLAYAVAGLLHLGARALGRQGEGWRARIALFWALLAIAPAMLAQGLFEAFTGAGAASQLTGLGVFALFVWFVARGLGAGYRKVGA